jgi:hypothetical protein
MRSPCSLSIPQCFRFLCGPCVVSKESRRLVTILLEGPQGCETSRIPHFLYIRLTDGGEVVTLTRPPPFTPRMIPGTHFS